MIHQLLSAGPVNYVQQTVTPATLTRPGVWPSTQEVPDMAETTRVRVTCPCGTEFLTHPCKIAIGRKYCSRPCYFRFRATQTGERNAAFRHGMDGTPEHRSWRAMRTRCLNPNSHAWDRYGGRGITICSEWDDFLVFLRDMGPRPGLDYSLDRIDNDGNYEPGNCRWATRSEQAKNRRLYYKPKPPCGTLRGYSWHCRYKQPPCEPCKAARNAHKRATKETPA